MCVLVWGLGRVVWLIQLLGEWRVTFTLVPRPLAILLGVMSLEETLDAVAKAHHAS